MSSLPHPIPDHAPLRPCPFCGRPGSVAAHRTTRDHPIRYSVGCWDEPDPFSRAAHWNDCLGPMTMWATDLDEAVTKWNRRARG